MTQISLVILQDDKILQVILVRNGCITEAELHTAITENLYLVIPSNFAFLPIAKKCKLSSSLINVMH